MAELVSGRDSVEQEFSRKELLEEIHVFLSKLSVSKRRMFLCRYWYFDSIAGIAARFGKTETNVSVILHRLRLQLQAYLKERGFDL